jgi:hypothetical protein
MGNCGMMGWKTALSLTEKFTFEIRIERIQSMIVTKDLGIRKGKFI